MQLEVVTDTSCTCLHCDTGRRAKKLIDDYRTAVFNRLRIQQTAVMTEFEVYALHTAARRELAEFELRVGLSFSRYLVGCCSAVYRVVAEVKD